MPRPILRPQMHELDSLRGIACLMVLFYHGFGNRFDFYNYGGAAKIFVWITSWGWTGVNLFFVLSGLLITGILLDTRNRSNYYRSFYVRRMLRILPPYYAILIMLAACWLFGLSGRTMSWQYLGLSMIYLPNVTPLFGVPIYFPVLWSLGVEEHFYLLWPALIRRMTVKTVFALALAICVATEGARIVAFHFGQEVFSKYTWLVADGLAMGAALAAVIRWSRQSRSTLWWVMGCSVGVMIGTVSVDRILRTPLAGGSLHLTAINASYTGLMAAALLFGSRFEIRSRILEFFGEVSYGLYLVHVMVFDLFDSAFPRLHSRTLPFYAICLRFAIVSAVSVLVAWGSRWYFEEPFLRLKNRYASVVAIPESAAVQRQGARAS